MTPWYRPLGLALPTFTLACGLFGADAPQTRRALLTAANFGELGPDHVYEAWVEADGEYTSFARFRFVRDEGLEVDVPLLDGSTALVISLSPNDESESESESEPVSPLLAGYLDQSNGSFAGMGDPLGLGTDFSQSGAAFVFSTPTTATNAGDYANGVWFADPTGTEAALLLPELAQGWIYEGWVETPDGRISTGRFLDSGPDSDGAGPAAGPDPGYPAPGQDFIDPPLSLPGLAIAITVEPDPDDDLGPFFVEPFVLREILDIEPPEITWMFKNDSLGHPSANLEWLEPPPPTE